MNQEQQTNQPEPFNWKKEALSWIQILVTATLIAYILTTFIIANSRIPSASMENTIMTNDRVIGSRLTYYFREPQRGDIVIFPFPDDESIYYVKRIIGLPGETVDVRDGHVYIDNSEVPLEEPYIKEPMIPEKPLHYQVPADSYFMMGDNRNYSSDSRRWNNTFVSRDKIIANVLFRYFPSIGLIK